MQANYFVISSDDLMKSQESLIEKALNAYEKRKSEKKIYFINQVAKKLGKSHATIKKLCEKGFIKVTASGTITQEALDEYLSGNNREL